MRKTLGIRPTNSVESNPGIRTRDRNPIAGPAPRFSPTRIYPECSARKSRHTRHVHLGGALRIDSLSFAGLVHSNARSVSMPEMRSSLRLDGDAMLPQGVSVRVE